MEVPRCYYYRGTTCACNGCPFYADHDHAKRVIDFLDHCYHCTLYNGCADCLDYKDCERWWKE